MAGEDNLANARELMDNYWNRDEVKVWSDENGGWVTDVAHDAQARIAELLAVVSYALIALAERTQPRE